MCHTHNEEGAEILSRITIYLLLTIPHRSFHFQPPSAATLHWHYILTPESHIRSQFTRYNKVVKEEEEGKE
jgi:hypothetical protein